MDYISAELFSAVAAAKRRNKLYVTVFRATGSSDEAMNMQYLEWASRLSPLLPELDGFISMKQFLAEDGEVCFIVEFRDEVSHRAWSEHPLHLAAKEFGRTYFSSYDIKVCELRYQRSSKVDSSGSVKS